MHTGTSSSFLGTTDREESRKGADWGSGESKGKREVVAGR